MTLSRVKGSTTPLRFTTTSCICSSVVKRRSQDGHWRRRRMLPPSSVVRESSTFESVLRQYGQCIADSSLCGSNCVDRTVWIELCGSTWGSACGLVGKLVDQSVYFLG